MAKHKPVWTRQAKIEPDELVIMDWLGAKAEVSGGRVSIKHLEPGSKGEQAARIALAKWLRSERPLTPAIRARLASLFDPAQGGEPRELVIKPRRKGKQPNPARDIAIAIDLIATGADENAGQFESAVVTATKKYRVSRATVMRAWNANKNWLLPPKDRTIN
jgi:hypothetical protein